MGVKIVEITKPYVKKITFDNLVGKIIAVDAFNVIYQFLSSIRGVDGEPLRDHQGNITSHLSGLVARNINLIENDIRAIYVFDGKPNTLKGEEIARRKEMRKIAEAKAEDAKDEENDADAAKYSKGTSRLLPEMVVESKKILECLGIPVVQAPEDGEAQAAYLIQKGKAWACGSQDYDAFLFGADRIVRNLSASQSITIRGIKHDVSIEWYSLNAVLEGLKITRDQLIDIAILVGVDFFPGIRGIGEKTAFKYISEYKNIEGFIKEKGGSINADLSVLTPDFLSRVRNIFCRPNITDDYSVIRPKPNYDKLREILVEMHDFSPDRVGNWIKRAKVRSTNCIQTTIGGSFLKK